MMFRVMIARALSPLALLRALLLSGLCLTVTACAMLPGRSKPQTIDSPSATDASPADLYVELAAVYARQGQPEWALKNAEKAIAADRSNYGGYLMRALIYQSLGETRLAEENFQRAVELAPKNPELLDAYGSYFCNQRRYAEAQTQYAKALQNPLYKQPWVTLTNAGNCSMRAGQSPAAQAFYRRALAANPNYGRALYMLADIEFNRDNTQAAQGYMGRYLNDYLRGEFPATADTAQALQLAIRIERKLGNTKAAETYEQILRSSFSSSGDAPATPQPSPSR